MAAAPTPRGICAAVLRALQRVGNAGIDERLAIAVELARVGDDVMRLWLPSVTWYSAEAPPERVAARRAPREDAALVWAPVTDDDLFAITGVPTISRPDDRFSYEALSAYPPLAICFALDACASSLGLDLEDGYGVLTEEGEVRMARGAFERSMVMKASRRLIDVLERELQGLLSREFGVALASVRSAYRVAEGYGADEHPMIRALVTAGAARSLETGWEILRDFGFIRRIVRGSPTARFVHWLRGAKDLQRRDALRAEIEMIPERLVGLSRRLRSDILATLDRETPWHRVGNAFSDLCVVFQIVRQDASFGHWVDVSRLLDARSGG